MSPSPSSPLLSSDAVPSVADLRARADALLPQLAVRSAERERDRIMPYDEIRQIADAGLFTFRVPTRYGGPGSTLQELFAFIVDLAAVDSNIAQSLRPGYLMVESLLGSDTDEEDRELWFARILDGDIVGNAGWERGGKNGEIRTEITRDGDRYLVNGVKSYSTGALFADWVTATAVDVDGEVAWFTVPRDRSGLHLVDDWDAAGQRLTASGTTRLENLVVHDEEVRRHGERPVRSPVVAVAQLFLGAVLAGIARNALADAVGYARDHARPIVHSAAERSTDDPYVQHAVGEISARAYAAEAVVLRAAAAIDRALDAAGAAERESRLTAAAIEVAQAQFHAAEGALRSGELVFEVGGASTALREHNLDRHWRNARTVANHNPRAYKASVVGAYRLTGAEPPTSGLF